MTNANEVIRREVPKIMGSSTGASNSPIYITILTENDSVFIVVIVVLVVIIIVCCLAVIYLLREDRSIGGQEALRRGRYNAQPLVDRDLSNPQHSRKWYSYLWGSRDRHHHTRLDKSSAVMGRNEETQSWIQATGREWDANDFSEDRALRSIEGNQSTGLLGMSQHDSSAISLVEPRAYTHRMPTSDGASTPSSSVLRYDPHDVRGLPYPDQFPVLPQATIPGITGSQSQLYSPTLSSPRSSPVPRQITKSPEPISNNTPPYNSVHDSDRDSQTEFVAPTVLRTAGSGTKFFESL